MSAATPAPHGSLPGNQLVDAARPRQTIEHCAHVLEFVRQASFDGHSTEIETGRFLVLGLVCDALAHAQAAMERRSGASV